MNKSENDLYQEYLEDIKYIRDDPRFKVPTFKQWKKRKEESELEWEFRHLCDCFFGVKNCPIFSELEHKYKKNESWRAALVDICAGSSSYSSQCDRTNVFKELSNYGWSFGLLPAIIRKVYI